MLVVSHWLCGGIKQMSHDVTVQSSLVWSSIRFLKWEKENIAVKVKELKNKSRMWLEDVCVHIYDCVFMYFFQGVIHYKGLDMGTNSVALSSTSTYFYSSKSLLPKGIGLGEIIDCVFGEGNGKEASTSCHSRWGSYPRWLLWSCLRDSEAKLEETPHWPKKRQLGGKGDSLNVFIYIYLHIHKQTFMSS